MEPMTQLAMLYAMNVGIGSLRGKRGSNLWKDAFKDTAMMALTQKAFQGKTPPGTATIDESMVLKGAHDKGKNVIDETFFEKFVKKPWEKTAGVFKSQEPMIGQGGQPILNEAGEVVMRSRTDPVKVGLGSIGLGGGLYAAGMFDPVDPPEPKYPGYNKFYAENPGQFMPYDDPDIDPIDYSKYPDKPYSNIKQGGIIGLGEGGESKPKSKALPLPGSLSWQQLYDQYLKEGLSPSDASASATATADLMPDITAFFQKKQQGGIASFQRGGHAANQPNQNIIEATNEEESRRLRQLGISHLDPQLSPEEVIPSRQPAGRPRIPYEDQPIEERGYGPGRTLPPFRLPTPTIDPQWFHPDHPRFKEIDVRGVKGGSLIDSLPSKTKVDENNPMNYKRTSGKLVVDSAGKGSENKDTMLAQLADGEFVTKSKAVRGAGLALGADPKNKKQQKDLGARYFYKQMAEFNKLAKSMAS